MNQKAHIAVGLLIRVDDVRKVVEIARKKAFVLGIVPSLRAAKRGYTPHNLPECLELVLRPEPISGLSIMETAASEFEPP